MEKKKIFIVSCFLFLGGICIVAAIFSSLNPQNLTVKSYSKKPKLLSEININSYVSLPVLEGMQILEVEVESERETAEKKAMEMLMESASRLDVITEDCIINADCIISQNGKYAARLSDKILSVKKLLSNTREDESGALIGKKAGDTIHIKSLTSFQGYEEAEVYLTVHKIYDMPYPVTEKYMTSNTEFLTFNDMVNSMLQNEAESVRIQNREEVMKSLLDEVVEKSTFLTIPDSLCKEELNVLIKTNENAQYDDARESLKKIFVIAALLNREDLELGSDMDARLKKYMEQGEKLSEYELERMQYLLYEEDITNYIYKNVEFISNSPTDNSEKNNIDASEKLASNVTKKSAEE